MSAVAGPRTGPGRDGRDGVRVALIGLAGRFDAPDQSAAARGAVPRERRGRSPLQRRDRRQTPNK